MLRNRKHEEVLKLKGVNHLDEETDLKLGEFELLQNFIPSEVYSIKKKRGIAPLCELVLASILTEDGDNLTTEDGDPLITEF